MQRELASLPLPPFVRSKLSSAGFLTVEDVINLKPSEIDKELGIGIDVAVDLLRLVRDGSTTSCQTTTAWDLINDSQLQQSIVTFSERLDELFGGGIPMGKLTEFCGAPGVGKTQLCLQVVVDVQIPVCFEGNSGEAIFIDTEGSFMVERLIDIAEAVVEHCRFIANSAEGSDEMKVEMERFTVESILEGVHYFHCLDHIQLIACIRTLASFLKSHPKVKVVVLDSIAFHFRHDFDDFLLRSRLLNNIAQTFNKLAAVHKLAVFVTNQMTTMIGTGDQSSQLVPALGESWAHVASHRVILYWSNRERHAVLYKSSSMKEDDVVFQITVAGVRDVIRTAPMDQSSAMK